MWLHFDRQLKLNRVEPEMAFAAELLKRAGRSIPSEDRQAFLNGEIGKIKYLRNNFDPSVVDNMADIEKTGMRREFR